MKYVESLDFYMSDKYINGVYDSCKNVINPASGALAMDFGCGHSGAKHCTARKWVCFQQYFVKYSKFSMMDVEKWKEFTKN